LPFTATDVAGAPEIATWLEGAATPETGALPTLLPEPDPEQAAMQSAPHQSATAVTRLLELADDMGNSWWPGPDEPGWLMYPP
jgi:hypothetical protein